MDSNSFSPGLVDGCQSDRFSTRPHICIVGGGFGGLSAALQLSKFRWNPNKRPHITLIDRSPSFLFTPFLYELITGEMQVWEIAPSFRKLLARKGIEFVQDSVETIDLANRRIQLSNQGSLSYDSLVLAAGRSTCLDLVPGAAEFVHPFRNLPQATQLLKHIRELETSQGRPIRIAVVGGGPNGVELAGKLADRLRSKGKILLVDRGDRLLKSFTPFSQKVAYQSLNRRGVELWFETTVEAVSSDRILLRHQNKPNEVAVDLIVGTVGTSPHPWITELPCSKNDWGQLLTRPTLQLAEYPNVFALGDCAAIRNPGGKSVPTTAQAAVQQASCVAQNVWASMNHRSLKRFRYTHLGEMLTLGVNEATFSSFGIHLSGRLACLIRRLVYLLLRMPTFRHRFHVAKFWLKRSLLLQESTTVSQTTDATQKV